MRVRVLDYPEGGAETLRCVCDLADCFPDDPEEQRHARAEIERAGRYWTGGGAAPLVLIMPVRDAPNSRLNAY